MNNDSPMSLIALKYFNDGAVDVFLFGLVNDSSRYALYSSYFDFVHLRLLERLRLLNLKAH